MTQKRNTLAGRPVEKTKEKAPEREPAKSRGANDAVSVGDFSARTEVNYGFASYFEEGY